MHPAAPSKNERLGLIDYLCYIWALRLRVSGGGAIPLHILGKRVSSSNSDRNMLAAAASSVGRFLVSSCCWSTGPIASGPLLHNGCFQQQHQRMYGACRPNAYPPSRNRAKDALRDKVAALVEQWETSEELVVKLPLSRGKLEARLRKIQEKKEEMAKLKEKWVKLTQQLSPEEICDLKGEIIAGRI